MHVDLYNSCKTVVVVAVVWQHVYYPHLGLVVT